MSEPRVTLRPELPPPPARIARLPLDRGYPVPWFVAWLDDDDNETPPATSGSHADFRMIASGAVAHAHRLGICWVCGERLGAYKTFLVGPMCAVNRTSAEPPAHRDCADWSARACPFLTRPHMRRREAGAPADAVEPGGIMLRRNPGVALVWVTRSYRLFFDADQRPLFSFGDPSEVRWYAEGRPATRAEVEASIDSGLPSLRELCDTPRSHHALDRYVDRARELLPA